MLFSPFQYSNFNNSWRKFACSVMCEYMCSVFNWKNHVSFSGYSVPTVTISHHLYLSANILNIMFNYVYFIFLAWWYIQVCAACVWKWKWRAGVTGHPPVCTHARMRAGLGNNTLYGCRVTICIYVCGCIHIQRGCNSTYVYMYEINN